MRQFDDSFSDLDLKCDFPARETFREALLERLLALNEQQAREATPLGSGASSETDPEIRELSDDELELLSAARGNPLFFQEQSGGSTRLENS